MSTSATVQSFAILGQRKLHNQAEVVHARGHNNRKEEVGNADPDAPAPFVIIGPEDAWQGVKDRLAELRIVPRKDAVLALELMMTASPEWFIRDRTGEVNPLQLQAFERMAMRYVSERFVPEAIISATWHQDEQTPHLHVVVLPVRKRVDQRFASREARWTLCARGDLIPPMSKEERPAFYATAWRGGIGGRGHMAFEQTRFAETMAPLRLVRGKVWSGAPNKPNAVWQAELRAAVQAAKIEREGLARDRAGVVAEADRQRDDAANLARQRAELDAERAGWAASIAAREAAMATERTRMDEERRALDERGLKAKRWAADAADRKVGLDEQRRRQNDREDALTARRDNLAALVATTTRVLASIAVERLPPPAQSAYFALAHEFGLAVKRAECDPQFAAILSSRGAWRPVAATR